MIKQTLLIASIFISLLGSAQANLDFESWYQFSGYQEPVGWLTFNSLSATNGTTAGVTRSTDSHGGTYSCQLTTTTVVIQGSPAILEGFVTLSSDYETQGIPYTIRPDSIVFWYKYVPQGLDNGLISVRLEANGDDIATAQAFITSHPQWTRGGVKLEYLDGGIPDTLILNFGSSAFIHSTEGSVLKIDNVEIIPGGPSVGLNELAASEGLLLFPNPVTDELHVKTSSAETVEIYDIFGSKVDELKSTGEASISVREYPRGVYILRTGEGITQRFVVEH